MQKLSLSVITAMFCLGIAVFIVGCESSSDPTGTASIQGNIVAFETATATFTPMYPLKESRIARLFKELSEIIAPSAQAASQAGRGGITVYVDGPVSQSTTTAEDGTFVCSGLPAGDYHIGFKYNGQDIMYRGNSGQMATISCADNMSTDLVNIRISDGMVNIGNIRMMPMGSQGMQNMP